jgi:hypothetical protein
MTPNATLQAAQQDTPTAVSSEAPAVINVLIVIDTDYVRANYPTPSQDPTQPTAIDHNSEFMICTGSRAAVTGQGTADLQFTANPGDVVRFYGQSIYGNAEDAVILYGIAYQTGGQVFNPFTTGAITRSGAAVPTIPNGVPATNLAANFISLDSMVATQGTEHFIVYFGLYVLDGTGENQTLFGYYCWDPSIVVQ